MDNDSERMQILQMIEDGRITAEEGLHLLKALNEDGEEALAAETEDAGQPAAEVLAGPAYAENPPAGLPADAARWRRWWTIPLWVGVGVTVAGALAMWAAVPSAAGTGSARLGLWFLCASVPFALGVLLIALAWASRSAPWLHLRVQQAPGEVPQRIALSFPLPLGLAAWFFRTFGRYIPALQDKPLEDMILAVGRSAGPENPIYIQVDEGESGEKVEIYIG